MNIREKFVQKFGEELAQKIEEAANSHRNGVNDVDIGDYFQWALLICIGYECLSNPEYRKFHNIPEINWEEISKWIKENAELDNYSGSLDYLSFMAGIYNHFVNDVDKFYKSVIKSVQKSKK